MKIKALLYCTKAKPYLVDLRKLRLGFQCVSWDSMADLNGKIVAECDYEVEWYDTFWCCSDFIEHKGLEKSCLSKEKLFDYVKGRNEFYAIHIQNLHIFDDPKELREYYTNRIYTKIENVYTDEVRMNNGEWVRPITNAPQNMMYAYDSEGNKYVIISIQPQWICKILNREKDVEVRKVVLKEMIK